MKEQERSPKRQKREANGELLHSNEMSVLSAADYSFTFLPSTNVETSFSFLSSAIPQELWKAHIVNHLGKEEKKALRSTCRGFLYLISQLWKPHIEFQHVQNFLAFPSQVCPKWPVQLYGLSLREANASCNFQILSQLHSLKAIEFPCYQEYPTDQDLTYLPRNLTKLDFWYCMKITDIGLQYLPSSLAELNVSYCDQITDIGLQYLPSSITDLRLIECNISDIGLQNLPSALVKLDLSSCHQITDIGLQYLPSSLTQLGLTDCEQISDIGLQYLPSSLAELNLSYCTGISDLGGKYLPRSLHTLNLCSCEKLTNEVVKVLSPNLLNLDLGYCEKLTDECLPFLPSTLKQLDLYHCDEITVEGLVQHAPTSLVKLSLYEYQFDEEEIAQLKATKPNLEIEFIF